MQHNGRSLRPATAVMASSAASQANRINNDDDFIEYLSGQYKQDKQRFSGTGVLFETMVAKFLEIPDKQQDAIFRVQGTKLTLQMNLANAKARAKAFDELKKRANKTFPGLIIDPSLPNGPGTCLVTMDLNVVLSKLIPHLNNNFLADAVRELYPEEAKTTRPSAVAMSSFSSSLASSSHARPEPKLKPAQN